MDAVLEGQHQLSDDEEAAPSAKSLTPTPGHDSDDLADIKEDLGQEPPAPDQAPSAVNTTPAAASTIKAKKSPPTSKILEKCEEQILG